MPFYDLHVYANQNIGENSLDDIASIAKKLGLDGLGIVRFHTEDIVELPKNNQIDFVNVVMIKVSSVAELLDAAKQVRNKTEILAVYGGNYDINRAACENSVFDILLHPEMARSDSGLDHICVRAAQENKVAIELNFREVVDSYKKGRTRILSSMRRNVMLCKKYGADIISTSGAMTKWGLRSGRDLTSLAYLLGLEIGNAIDTVSLIPEEAVKKNREKLVGRMIEGARIIGE